MISDEIARLKGDETHAAGTLSPHVLRRLEELLPRDIGASVETGCGKSTILLSNLSRHHTVFCVDDRGNAEQSSIRYYEECPLTKRDRIELVLGPTQATLPRYTGFRPYDVVLIDGPHGFPFPELEYYWFYPHLRPGGVLILDDVHIATIGRLADVVAEDAMFELLDVVSCTAVFRRTDAPTFNPLGDGWWEQSFNRRRVPDGAGNLARFVLRDGKRRIPFVDQFGFTDDTPLAHLGRRRLLKELWHATFRRRS